MTAIPSRSPDPQHVRSYEVKYQRDLRGSGLDWRMYGHGYGRWCLNSYAAFGSETEAHAAGKRWVKEGRVS